MTPMFVTFVHLPLCIEFGPLAFASHLFLKAGVL